jgi:hypothetical protein
VLEKLSGISSSFSVRISSTHSPGRRIS